MARFDMVIVRIVAISLADTNIDGQAKISSGLVTAKELFEFGPSQVSWRAQPCCLDRKNGAYWGME